jgi:septum formation protein
VITQTTPLILGSASPRRRDLLTTLGLPLRIVPGAADEAVRAEERPEEYLERVVAEKLVSVASRLEHRGAGAVLVADTIVVLGETILGKPVDEADARRLVRQLVGRTHVVCTRFAVAAPGAPTKIGVARTVRTRVVMRAATAEEVERYAATGEGLDKAGAYAVQGIGSMFVERLEGSYTNVVGLPVCEVVVALQSLGLLGDFP